MRVLTWNLYHGRGVPPAGRSLRREFAAALAGWEWDVALLQEVPPWWRFGPVQDTVLTSRNQLLPVQRAIAARAPDLLKAWGGGANAIVVRDGAITARAAQRLRLWPERRMVHAVRLDSGAWVANLHAQVHSRDRAQDDLDLAARTVLRWAGPDAPVVLGGDFNQPRPHAEGFTHAGGRWVDHVLVRGWRPAGRAQVLDHGDLSDHAPVLVMLAP